MTLFWSHPDADASSKKRSWFYGVGTWYLTIGQGFEDKLSHLPGLSYNPSMYWYLYALSRGLWVHHGLLENIFLSVCLCLWDCGFSCSVNIKIFNMPLSKSFAHYCCSGCSGKVVFSPRSLHVVVLLYSYSDNIFPYLYVFQYKTELFSIGHLCLLSYIKMARIFKFLTKWCHHLKNGQCVILHRIPCFPGKLLWLYS